MKYDDNGADTGSVPEEVKNNGLTRRGILKAAVAGGTIVATAKALSGVGSETEVNAPRSNRNIEEQLYRYGGEFGNLKRPV